MTALTQRTTAGYFGPEPLRLRPIPLHQLLELLHPWTHIQDAIFLFLIGSPCDRRILSILAQTGSLIGFMPSHPWWLLCLAAFVCATLVTAMIITGYTILTIWKWAHAPNVPQTPRRAMPEDLGSKSTHAV